MELESTILSASDEPLAKPNMNTEPLKVEITEDKDSVFRIKAVKRPRNHFAHDQQRMESISSSSPSVSGNESRTATGMTRRCHCNLSQCASTNYMCKSERRSYTNEDGSTTEVDAGCFVEELSRSHFGVTEANGRVTSARRGCVEHLSREKLKLCSDRTGAPMHCCFNEDMCNYPKTFYPPQFHPPGLNRGIASQPQQPLNLDQQVWIRAALICVPICGLMILLVLIVVARKLLKGDDEYKETGAGSGEYPSFYHPNNNKYGNYYFTPPHPSPPPPPIAEYRFIKPVFNPSEYGDEPYFSPIEVQRRQRQCCHCHNRREPNESHLLLASDSTTAFPFPSPSSSSSASNGNGNISTMTTSEDLVTRTVSARSLNPDPDDICQCSSDSDDGRCHCADEHHHCNMIRPPSIVFAGGGPFLAAQPEPAPATAFPKFNTLLSKLGFVKKSNGPTIV